MFSLDKLTFITIVAAFHFLQMASSMKKLENLTQIPLDKWFQLDADLRPADPLPYRLMFRLANGAAKCEQGSLAICFQSQLRAPAMETAKFSKRFQLGNQNGDGSAATNSGGICKGFAVETDRAIVVHWIRLELLPSDVGDGDKRITAILTSTFGDRYQFKVKEVNDDDGTILTIELLHVGETVVSKLILGEGIDSVINAMGGSEYLRESPLGAHLSDFAGLWLLGLDIFPFFNSDAKTEKVASMPLLVVRTGRFPQLDAIFLDSTDFVEEGWFNSSKGCGMDRITSATTPKSEATTSSTEEAKSVEEQRMCNVSLKLARPVCVPNEQHDVNGVKQMAAVCAVKLGWLLLSKELSSEEGKGNNNFDFLDQEPVTKFAEEIKTQLAEFSSNSSSTLLDELFTTYKETLNLNSTSAVEFKQSTREWLSANWGLASTLHFQFPFFVLIPSEWAYLPQFSLHGPLQIEENANKLVAMLVHECVVVDKNGQQIRSRRFASAAFPLTVSFSPTTREDVVEHFLWPNCTDRWIEEFSSLACDTGPGQDDIYLDYLENIPKNENRNVPVPYNLTIGYEGNITRSELQLFEFIFGGLDHLGLRQSQYFGVGQFDPHWRLSDFEHSHLFGGHYLFAAQLALQPKRKAYLANIHMHFNQWIWNSPDSAKNWKNQTVAGDSKNGPFFIDDPNAYMVVKEIYKLRARCEIKAENRQFTIHTGRVRLVDYIIDKGTWKVMDFIIGEYPSSIKFVEIPSLEPLKEEKGGRKYPLEMDAYAYGYKEEVDDE